MVSGEAFSEHCRVQRSAAWYWHSPLSAKRRNRVQTSFIEQAQTGARWENTKIKQKKGQLQLVVNNIKEAREKRVVAVETMQSLNKSSIGRTEAAVAEYVGIVYCLSFASVKAVKSCMCQERCGFSLCCFNECSGSGLSEDGYRCPALHISSSLREQHEREKCLLREIKVKPVCMSSSYGYLLSVLCRFDWCVCLNSQHLPHMPMEAGRCSIIHCLGSHCRVWQQSDFWMLTCMSTLFFRLSSSISLCCGLPRAC